MWGQSSERVQMQRDWNCVKRAWPWSPYAFHGWWGWALHSQLDLSFYQPSIPRGWLSVVLVSSGGLSPSIKRTCRSTTCSGNWLKATSLFSVRSCNEVTVPAANWLLHGFFAAKGPSRLPHTTFCCLDRKKQCEIMETSIRAFAGCNQLSHPACSTVKA